MLSLSLPFPQFSCIFRLAGGSNHANRPSWVSVFSPHCDQPSTAVFFHGKYIHCFTRFSLHSEARFTGIPQLSLSTGPHFNLTLLSPKRTVKCNRFPRSVDWRATMSFYCLQVRYTTGAWSRLVCDPLNRCEAVRYPIEKIGGTIHATFFASGPFDVLAICELPDSATQPDISVAFASGGAIASVQAIPLITTLEAIDAWSKSAATPIAPSTPPVALAATAR
jgi:uncharacterized protein with GYD domain